MLDVETVFDALEMRCPRLGGEVTFAYCRKIGDGLPCTRSLICWEAPFPVADYMARVLTEDEWRAVFEAPPKKRLDAILEAASQALEQSEKGQG